MKLKAFMQVLCAAVLSSVLFLSVIFVMTRENLVGVDVPKTDVPYSDSGFIPQNTTVLFVFPDSFGVAIDLDFEKKFTSAVIIKDASEEIAAQYGFQIAHTCVCDYPFMMDFIDIIGGIELDDNGESYRYTGVQICNVIASFPDDIPLRARIIEAIFLKISKYGLSDKALSCIIEDTRTSLSTPSCYGWTENMDEVLSSFNILNER